MLRLDPLRRKTSRVELKGKQSEPIGITAFGNML
jgi:hypothetical protein